MDPVVHLLAGMIDHPARHGCEPEPALAVDRTGAC